MNVYNYVRSKFGSKFGPVRHEAPDYKMCTLYLYKFTVLLFLVINFRKFALKRSIMNHSVVNPLS